MYIETTIRVNFKTQLGDTFDNIKLSKKEIDETVKDHIKEFAIEHNLDLADIEIIKVRKFN